MSTIRITSGLYKNTKLEVPRSAHPMGERERTAIFNSLGDRVVDASVLDAFAGSGALGLESLSRGASSATFLENDRQAQKIIKENIAKLGLTSAIASVMAKITILLPVSEGVNSSIKGMESSREQTPQTLKTWPDGLPEFDSSKNQKPVKPDAENLSGGSGRENSTDKFKSEFFDIIFADPPYDNPQLPLVKTLTSFLTPSGTFVLSLPKSLPAPTFPELELISDKTYARAHILIYQK